MGSLKNKLLARVFSKYPSLAKKMAERNDAEPLAEFDLSIIPWTPSVKPLKDAKVALVTTAGLHLKSDAPFDMQDPDGDPTWRAIASSAQISDYTITHDYYDHSDADKDINVVFPIERLAERVKQGKIGRLAEYNYSFMGHIDGPHIRALIESTAKEVARKLLEDNVDIALLTPG